ncbi:MAG: response regulator [Proteobacteria bacterium]|nr:response regulator [Pseudomonadota bacterium]
MEKEISEENKRILVIDDDAEICNVYKKVLSPQVRHKNSALQQMENLLDTGKDPLKKRKTDFIVEAASQGQKGFELVKASIEQKKPFAVAFIDIRMPPGWDGMETAKRIRAIDSHIEIVIVTAYSDRSRDEIVQVVGAPEKLLFLRKPFDSEEILQLALSLTEKWNIARKEEKTKSELIRSESRFRALVETTSDFVWETDADGRFTYCSPVCENMYGYQADELIGLSLFNSMAYRGDGIALENFFTENSDTQTSFYNIERSIQKKNGQQVYVETSGTKVFNQNGAVINYRGIDRDITQRKQNEEEKIRLEKQYRQSQKMEAIGTLAGGIAHDFNNILSVIMGYTQLAKNALPVGSAAKTFLEKVMLANNRAAELIHQILAFSRQTEKEMKPINMGAAIKETLHMLRASLPSTIKISQDIQIELGKDVIRADATQINQMLMNLCTNAAQSMKSNGGRLYVSLESIEIEEVRDAIYSDLNPGAYLKISVSDTGHGMDQQVMEKIFEPFYSTKQVGEGTGLGLSVVHGIVKNHGGVIKVYSRPGKGSTFTIILPRFKGEGSVESKFDTGFTEIPTGTEKILFVDDEKDLVDIGKELIGSLGYKVTATSNSMEALKIFTNQYKEFDLVITDMTMPDMTGEILAKNILTIRPDMPIILCSGFTDATVYKKVKAIGVREYVMKPFNLPDIAKVIRKVLDV